MQTFNIHEAKTHLSKLVELAANGENFIIAKAGRPMVEVSPISKPHRTKKRVGFMNEEVLIPDDFDSLNQEEILKNFGIEE